MMAALMTLLAASSAAAAALVPPIGLRVCTNTACRKAGSQDTYELIAALASTAEQVAVPPRTSLSACQAAFAATRVQRCGCLGGCGSGPNVATTDDTDAADGIFRDVYKPASAAALLAHIGVHVPDEAVKAWLRRMYAVRSMRANKPAEAHALLTEALGLAAPLKRRGCHLLSLLLDERADISEGLLGDASAAAADRERAAQLRELTSEEDSEEAGDTKRLEPRSPRASVPLA